MARVVLERNMYKEQLLELREAIRWTETLRASRNETTHERRHRSSIWDLYMTSLSALDSHLTKRSP